MNNILSLLGLSLLLLPSVLLVRYYLGNSSWFSRSLWFVFLVFTLVPLSIFYAYHFAGAAFSPKNVWLILIIINAVTYYFCRFLPLNPVLPAKPDKSSADLPPLYWLGLLLLAFLVFAYPYLINQQPIIGGDSAQYLQQVSLIFQTRSFAQVFDRSLVYAFPATLHVVTHLPVETIFKLIVTGFEIIFVLLGTKLALSLLSPRLSLVVGLSLIFSLAEFYLAKFNISFFLGMVLIYFLGHEILDRGDRTPGNLLLPFLWGALFNLHGVIAFASLGILLPILFFNVPVRKWTLPAALSWFILFVLSGQPLIFSQGARLTAGFIHPVVTTFDQTYPIDTTEEAKFQAQVWVDEYTNSRRPGLNQFPLQSANFIGNYSAVVVWLALAGFVFLIFRPGMRKSLKATFIIFGGSLFLLTQQEYFGLNWFPNRFLLSLGPIITIFAVFALRHFGRIGKSSDLGFYFAVALLTLPNLLTTLPKISRLSANISPANYQFIRQLKTVLPEKAVIFVAGHDGRWIQGLLPDSRVFLTHPAAICSDRSFLTGTFDYQWWQVGQAFSRDLNLAESVATFKRFSQNQPYYLYLDPSNYRCINGPNFPAPDYTQILRFGELVVLYHS